MSWTLLRVKEKQRLREAILFLPMQNSVRQKNLKGEFVFGNTKCCMNDILIVPKWKKSLYFN